jgi:hypothetical protein
MTPERDERLPATPAALDPERARALDALTAAAWREERHALAAGLDGALGHVPRLLRAPVKKLFGA